MSEFWTTGSDEQKFTDLVAFRNWGNVKWLYYTGNLDGVVPEQQSSMKLNLDYKEMPILPYRQRGDLPSGPGIYYVGCPDYPVLYVGLARNLRNRHVAHHRQDQFREMQHAEIRYRILDDTDIDEVATAGCRVLMMEGVLL
ncbi:GIY-YIG nuclease family protein [Trichocoleus sp. FACHB-591]|uniref:GIY-YIG nuclease family protein n=1 Tax=Trichocoleus sp. FACHB-591 TaxID=2692872 RepID=UPI0016832DDC|nr:GIY-YIG nuclease family protein [Trichocoleus sp. FACHB-591]MBD2094446.1 GIY-YIG nuclease family protein [Trichocoleus sp. FACHB-591]